jgi:hypothetical protein
MWLIEPNVMKINRTFSVGQGEPASVGCCINGVMICRGRMHSAARSNWAAETKMKSHDRFKFQHHALLGQVKALRVLRNDLLLPSLQARSEYINEPLAS